MLQRSLHCRSPNKPPFRRLVDASGFTYPASEIFPFMNWRAAILASNAVSKKNIECQLVEELDRDFAGGKEFTQSEDGQTKIGAMVASKRLGSVKWGWVGPKKKATLVEGVKITARQTRHSLLVAAMQKFPHSLTAEAGYRCLQKALVGTAFQLVKGKAAEKAVSQVRKAVGYSTQRTKSGWIWVKVA